MPPAAAAWIAVRPVRHQQGESPELELLGGLYLGRREEGGGRGRRTGNVAWTAGGEEAGRRDRDRLEPPSRREGRIGRDGATEETPRRVGRARGGGSGGRREEEG